MCPQEIQRVLSKTPTPPISRHFCYHFSMKRLLPVLMVFGVFLGSAGESFAVDYNHIFTRDSITTKPVRSDYSSEAAFAADSLVYGIPRTCTWSTTTGGNMGPMSSPTHSSNVTKHGRITPFQLGVNLRKSANSNWYANSAKAFASYGTHTTFDHHIAPISFSTFTYVNGNTGEVACGPKHLSRRGGSWSDGKWYKTFDLVLRTNKAGGGSTAAAKGPPPNCQEIF